MPRIKEGFKGERAIVLPAFLIETQHRGSNRVYPYLLYGGRRVV